MTSTSRPFAIVTGASAGIGYELAKLCAEQGFDLLVAADEPEIEEAANAFRRLGSKVDTLQADLATEEGVGELYDAAAGRSVDALLANAGGGLGGAFLDQDLDEARRVLDTNVTGTIYLLHKIGNDMRGRGAGRILITGSIAGFIPGDFQAAGQISGKLGQPLARGTLRMKHRRLSPPNLDQRTNAAFWVTGIAEALAVERLDVPGLFRGAGFDAFEQIKGHRTGNGGPVGSLMGRGIPLSPSPQRPSRQA